MKQEFTKFGMLVAMLLASLPASAYDYDFEVDGIYYSVISLTDLTCKVVHGDDTYEGEVVIPSEVDYKGRKLTVSEIGEGAFYWSGVTSVSIPESVRKIGVDAFSYCYYLASITIPQSVTEIGYSAFWNCMSLTSLTIPDSVTDIGVETFGYCSSLGNIILSKNLTKINSGTFEGCQSLSSLTIPGKVEVIVQYESGGGKYPGTFGMCESLKEMRFMYGDSELKSAFESSYKIKTSKWESWTEQLEKVFFDREMEYYMSLPNLKELTIGEHMKYIPINSLSKCNQIENIVCYAITPPSTSKFSDISYQNTVVKVPAESLAAYQAHEVWGNFWNLQGFDTSGVDDVEIDSVDKTVVGRYDLNGRPVNEDYKGITIVRFSDGTTQKVID